MCKPKVTMGLAATLMLFGVITIVMGVTVTTGSSWVGDLMPENDNAASEKLANDVGSLGKVGEVFIYLFGIWMLIMGATGAMCCGKKYKGHKICVTIFLIFQACLAVATFVLAVLPFGVYMTPPENLAWFCSQTSEELTTYFSDKDEWYKDYVIEGRAYVTDVDTSLAARSAIMCTSVCPCAVTSWDAWTTAADADIGNDFTTTGLEMSATGVSDWAACEELLGAMTEDSDAAHVEAAKNYYNSLLEVLEDDFACQGICEGSAFWLYGDVAEGPAWGYENACLPKMQESFKGKSLGASIVLFITVLIDLMLFICMFGNCKAD